MIKHLWHLLLIGLLALAPSGVIAQCAFDIDYDQKDICEKEAVTFSIKNAPASIKSIEWLFGSTKIPNDKNPKVIYPNAGKFSVSLTITLTNNTSCTVTETDLITVARIPDMGKVTVDKAEACGTDDRVTFTNSSTGATSWDWRIEGKRYTTKKAGHKFEFTGHPFVQLTVENKEGCINRMIFDSLVHVLPKPTVDLGPSALICELPGTLKVAPTYNYKGVTIKSHQWDFKGSTVPFDLKEFPADKFYNSPGVYNITLEMKSARCDFNYTFKKAVDVYDFKKLRAISKPVTAKGCQSLKHVLVIRGVKDTSEIHWELDSKQIAYIDSSIIDSITVVYKNNGKYTNYVVVDRPPCRKKLPLVADAKDGGITAAFNVPECVCDLPGDVIAKNLSKGSITQYEWEVTNGAAFSYSDNQKDLDFTVNSLGLYHVQLKVSDSKGCFDLISKPVRVQENSIITDKIQQLACLTDEFFVPKDSICGFDANLMVWRFLDKDGNEVDKQKGNVVRANFPDTGWHSISISLRTASGCFDSVYLDKYVYVEDCFKKLRVRVSPDSACVGNMELETVITGSTEIKISAELVLSSDTTKTVRLKYDFPYLKGQVILPGIYHLRMTITMKDGSGSKSYYVKNIFKANRLQVTGEIVSTTGCYPDKKVVLRVKETKNELFWDTDNDGVTYVWSRQPEEGTSLSSKNGTTTTLTISTLKQVDVELLALNRTGCDARWQVINKVAKTLEAKFSIPSDVCFGDTFSIKNLSKGKVARYEWTSSESGDGFSPGNFVSNPELHAAKEGLRTIRLTVWDKDDCSSYWQETIDLVDLKMDFTVLDTSARCSPASFDFKITGKNAQKYVWYFGDGDTVKTRQKAISKIYDLRRVYPYQNVFSVRLTGTHSSGCEQTRFKQDIIKLRGPYPRFEIKDKEGCSPHTATFVNESKNVARSFFEFDANVSAISGFPDNYEYESDTNEARKVFKPYMVAYDKYDCRAVFRPTDSIIVHTMPVARFGGNPRTGCEPLDVTMKSRSRFAKSFKWNIPETSFNASKQQAGTVLNAGWYDLQLEVANDFGCTDTKLKEKFYHVFAKPFASFKPQDSVGCIGKDFVVYDKSYSDVPITSYQWYATGDAYADSSRKQDFRPNLSMLGKVDIRLEIENQNGCRDSFEISKALNVYNALPAELPVFSYISHLNNQEMEINWNIPKPDYFRLMNLYKISGGSSPVFSTKKFDENRFVHENPYLDTASNCYQLELVDRCSDTHFGELHCSVHLDVDESVSTATHLSWNHYQGWDSIVAYKVFRAAVGDNFIHLKTVPGSDTSYIDSSFCDSSYEYKVTALAQKRGLASNSNSLEYQPEYTYQDEPLEILVTSVLDNKHVITHWKPSKQLGNLEYFINRREQLDGKRSMWRSTSDTFIIDKRAKIHDFHYSYKIRVKDKCDNIAGLSNMGRSILLNVEQGKEKVYLRWNKYQHWENGVSHYILEVKPPGQSHFSVLSEQKDTAFFDKEAYLEYELPYVYRVKAVENGDNPDTSYSNERIVIPVPSIYAPNAFSPNGDGVNDSFHVRGWALLEDPENIDEFTLKIFNRWGERVFEAHDLSHGWDGTFKGEACSLDHYVWVAKATALNGTVFFLKGGVTIIR